MDLVYHRTDCDDDQGKKGQSGTAANASRYLNQSSITLPLHIALQSHVFSHLGLNVPESILCVVVGDDGCFKVGAYRAQGEVPPVILCDIAF
jgi:hypothetical protein